MDGLEADDYNHNDDDTVKLRVLLVSRVVVGKPHKRKHNATCLTEPPCGYHSVDILFSTNGHPLTPFKVIGEPGADLNFEETVVYNNDAIRPTFLIVYGDPPIGKSKLKELVSALFKTPLTE